MHLIDLMATNTTQSIKNSPYCKVGVAISKPPKKTIITNKAISNLQSSCEIITIRN